MQVEGNFSVAFSRFTSEDSPSKRLAAGRLVEGMLLTDANGLNLAGMEYEQALDLVKNQRPLMMTWVAETTTKHAEKVHDDEKRRKELEIYSSYSKIINI